MSPETVRVIPSAISIERKDPSSFSIASFLVGLYGAFLSTALFVYKWRTEGVHLVFSVSANSLTSAGPGQWMVFGATNRGSKTTTLTGTLILRRFPSRLHVLLGRSAGGQLVVTAPTVRGAFPFEASTGAKWTAFLRQDELYDEWLESPYLYAYLAHSGSSKPARTRVRKGGRIERPSSGDTAEER